MLLGLVALDVGDINSAERALLAVTRLASVDGSDVVTNATDAKVAGGLLATIRAERAAQPVDDAPPTARSPGSRTRSGTQAVAGRSAPAWASAASARRRSANTAR